MAHKKKHGGTVPAGNRPKAGPAWTKEASAEAEQQTTAEVPSSQEHDPKGRIGDFCGKGEHSIQEPGGKKDANH